VSSVPISAKQSGDLLESEVVDHRLIGSRMRPPPSDALITKGIVAGVAAGLSEVLAETLVHAAADQQQLRHALRSPKVQRFGTEEFTYVEIDALMWRVLPSPDNIRFEGDHARGTVGMPRFGSVKNEPLLTFEMDSTEDLIDAMGPRIADMAEANPHVGSILARGIESPGWLGFLRLTTDTGTVTRLESTDGYGRTVAAQLGLGITFKDAAWNLTPGSRRAANFHRDIAAWAVSADVTDEQARKVRCSIMPNAKVIIGYASTRGFDRARRRLVAHLHMSPPMSFTVATTLNAKANAAVDRLHENQLLPELPEYTAEEIRDILDGTNREHDLLPDEVAVLACGALNPHQNKRQAKVVNEAIADLTGTKPQLEERTALAAEVALRGFPADKRLTGLRSALERTWRWSELRGVALTLTEPLDLLADAIPEVVHRDKPGPAIAELAGLASYHLVSGKTQLLVRSEFGGRSSNTEPQTIMRQMTRSVHGLRQLCQIVLDGRAGRKAQELPDGTTPQDANLPDAHDLTQARLRELANVSDTAPIGHQSADDRFAEAIKDFKGCLADLHSATMEMAEVADSDGVPLVDIKGYDDPEVRRHLVEITELVSDWRSARKRANRMRPDLDDSGTGR